MKSFDWHSDKILVLNPSVNSTEIAFELEQAESIPERKWVIDSLTFLLEFVSGKETFHFKTSGSTGTPKVLEFKRNQLLASAQQTIDFFGITANWTLLHCLPVSFVAGKMMLVRAIVAQAKVVLVAPQLNPLVDLIHESMEFDFAAFTPAQLQTILENDASVSSLNKIKHALIGGGTMNEKLIQNLHVYQGITWLSYGMTETLTHVAIRQVAPKHEKMFRALPGVTFTQAENGCLIIDAKHLEICKLETTDTVELINATAFEWTGRIDHVINSGGLKLNPEVIENELKRLLDYEFFITKIAHDTLGETVALVLEKESLTADELVAIKNSFHQLSNKHFRPTKIGYTANFQRTESHKIQRSQTLKAVQFLD